MFMASASPPESETESGTDIVQDYVEVGVMLEFNRLLSHYAQIFCYYAQLCSSLIGELLCSNLCWHNVPRPNDSLCMAK